MHALQSGVAMEHSLGSKDGSPKHLRVGVNLAMCDIGSLAGLLITKGIITIDELHASIIMGVETEVRRYEQELSRRVGRKVVLLVEPGTEPTARQEG